MEISKVYECPGDKIKKPKIQILARHPSNFNPPLICLKINNLKKIAKENEVDASNKDIKKEIRKSIFEQTKLKFDDNLKIDIDEKGDTDVKTIWDKLKNEFPLFLLFRADRTNTEKDKEVNDTTKAITKVAVQELQAQFEEMQKKRCKHKFRRSPIKRYQSCKHSIKKLPIDWILRSKPNPLIHYFHLLSVVMIISHSTSAVAELDD